MTSRDVRIFILKSFKWTVIGAFLLMLGHVALLLLDCPLDIAERMVFLSPIATITSLGLSIALRYCYVHQLCLIYCGSISQCIRVQQYGQGFGDCLVLARALALVIGLMILFLIVWRKVDCGYDNKGCSSAHQSFFKIV